MPSRHSLLWKILFIICELSHLLASDNQRYINYTLEQNKVCGLYYSTFNNYGLTKSLSVGRDDKSAIIVKQTSYFKQFTGQHELKCTFVVKAAFENYGIFAVIKTKNFRKDLSTDSCIDYIEVCQYKESTLEKVSGIHYPACRNPIRRVCGLPLETGYDSDGILMTDGFYEKSGQIAIKIVLGQEKMEPNEDLDFEIVFTSFFPCRRDMGAYKMCSPSSLDEGACIHKDYFNDGIKNCPFNGCGDECGVDKSTIEPSRSTKITVTAVTSIFLSFFFFLGCIWLCRSCEVLCWSVETLRSPRDHRRDSDLSEFRPSAPSAASAEDAAPNTASLDKDLPPAYETLFPER